MILGLVERWLKLLLAILHYFLILARWVYRRRYYILYIPLTITFWLYYEIKYTSPGCAFYSGRKATRLLNGCNFISNSYRPPIYVFSSTLQWLYMSIYNNLELLSRLLQSNYFECLGNLRRPFYYCISKICRLIINSPLFKSLYNNDVYIAQREIIESYGRSPIILDWYLPPWLVNKCGKCNRPKPLNQFMKVPGHRSQQLNKSSNNFSFIPSEKSFSENYNQESRNFFFRRLNSMENKSVDDNFSAVDAREFSIFHALKTSMNPLSKLSFRRKNSNVEHTKLQQSILESLKRIESTRLEEFYFEDGNMTSCGDNNESQYNNSDSSYFIPNTPCDYNIYCDNSVTRGIILILPDYNMPYNICNQHTGCICNAWDIKTTEKFKNPTCDRCLISLYKDAHSYNKETPCLSFTKLFIADALKAGFICVEIHLNVNMGLPIHIKGHWLGMTSYPFSLYGNAISDLDCAVGRISNRYPNLSIQSVGFGGGCSILTEYLLRASDSRFIEKLEYAQKGDVANGAEIIQKSIEIADKKNSTGFGGKVDIGHMISSDNEKSFYSSSTESDIGDDDIGKKSIMSKKKKKKKKKVAEKVEKPKKNTSVEEINDLESVDSAIYQDVFTVRDAVQLEDKEAIQEYTKKKKRAHRTSTLMKRSKISEKGFNRSKIVEEKSKVYYNKLIHSVSCINLNLKVGSEFFHFITSPSKKHDFIKKSYILSALYNIIRKIFWAILSLNLQNYKDSCKNQLRENIELLLRRIHCSRDVENLDKMQCKSYKCCHETTTLFGNIQHNSIFDWSFDRLSDHNLYALLSMLHKEFNEAYNESLINPKIVYRSSLLPVNNANWTLTIGDGYYSKCDGFNKIRGLINPNDDISTALLKRFLRKLYYDNTKLVRTCLGSLNLPVLFISSLDNSLFGVHDIDVYQPIRNSNILHFVTQSGGDCTYLTGLSKPSYWLKFPILEFLQAAIANKQEAVFN